jgi:hypothetical protein
MTCPPLEQLIADLRGLLQVGERAALEAHLASGCRRCAENRRWLAEAADLAAAEPPVDVSEATMRSMVNWFRARPMRAPRSVPQRLASLIFDSLTASQPLAVRRDAGHRPRERQLLFRAEGYEVDLRLDAAAEGGRLVGQILPEDGEPLPPAAAHLELHDGEKVVAAARSEVDGLFHLRGIPPGVYDLKIEVDDQEIIVSPVETIDAP